MWTVDDEKNQIIVPIQEIKIKALLDSGVACVDMQLTFKNMNAESPLECTFSYPIEKDVVVGKLMCSIDDRVIEAKVKSKGEAKNVYADAVASGKTAVYAERKEAKDEEIISLSVGNLLPGQSAVINLQTMSTVQVNNSCYDFTLISAWFPNYKTHKIIEGS